MLALPCCVSLERSLNFSRARFPTVKWDNACLRRLVMGIKSLHIGKTSTWHRLRAHMSATVTVHCPRSSPKTKICTCLRHASPLLPVFFEAQLQRLLQKALPSPQAARHTPLGAPLRFGLGPPPSTDSDLLSRLSNQSACPSGQST